MIIKNFGELTLRELHAIYLLRSQVFVVEQNCAYQDVDEKDLHAIHIFEKEGDHIISYARILPPGVAYGTPAIGRVVVHRDARRHGRARKLMLCALAEIRSRYDAGTATVSAQCYLEDFYSSLGFIREGDDYPEDGIPHLKMVHSF